jgi:hypothetical protein
MHPLDSSLDASVHGHHGPSGGRRVVRRRSSIDNGLLLLGGGNNGSKELLIARVLSGSSDGGGSNGGDGRGSDFFAQHYRSGPRRLSLNLNSTTNTTFLATNTVGVLHADKCDLDKDCHLWSDEDYARNGPNTASLHSHAESQQTMSAARRSVSASSGIVSMGNNNNNNNDNNDDSTVSFDGSQDSFCEATGAEPANSEYLMQDLGASCFWNDADFCSELQRRKESKHNVASYGNEHNETSSPHSLHEMSTDELDYEPSIVDQNLVLGSSSTNPQEAQGGEVVMSYHTSNTDDEIDDDDQGGDMLFAHESDNDDEQQVLQFLQNEHISGETSHGDDNDGVHEGGDFSSECESFCDADETERANTTYLQTDLGASCCWHETDLVLTDIATTTAAAAANRNSGNHETEMAINTITEEA